MSTDPAEPVDPADTAARLGALVAALLATGELRSPEWQAAFERVPRHVFVPRFFFDREHIGQFRPVDGRDPAQQADWLTAVYSNEALITQLGGDDHAWQTAAATGTAEGMPTSSSSMPGLMALMLEALGIADGMRVLEVGTGTGYNAALLCERLGSPQVTSVDVDPLLVEAARGCLATLGYAPTLAAADGTRGYPPGAPYDRIVATVGLPGIPSAWLDQTREQGRILTNLYRGLGGGALALLTMQGGAAAGHFLPDYGGFMPIRAAQPPAITDLLRTPDPAGGERRAAVVGGQVLDDPAFCFLAALRISARLVEQRRAGMPDQYWLLSPDGSWACQVADENGRSVAQHGPHRLWDELEAAHRDWESLGRPPREAFGLTVSPDGRHTLWCGDPGRSEWELPR